MNKKHTVKTSNKNDNHNNIFNNKLNNSSLNKTSNFNLNNSSNNNDEVLYHTMPIEEVLNYLKTDSNGLTDEEAAKRRAIYGKNALEEAKRKTIFSMFIEQFKNIMIIILLIAAVISGFLKEVTDAIVILVVVIINAVIGVIQENKAEHALEALKKLSLPYAKVKRDGTLKMIKTDEIVPGDIVYLEAGDFVPADMRLIETINLKIDEAALTGESVPIDKFTKEITEKDIVIGDKKNMAFSGTIVVYGRGVGVATHTGMNTEVGKIAGFISKSEPEETPLQKKLAEMSKYISVGVVAIAVIIFLTGLINGRELLEMFLTSVSLAVAAIPEGLPAVVTIVLAIGVQKMSNQNAIIRKLPAVETLGCTNIICTDKTGTLTENIMTVTHMYLNREVRPVNEANPASNGFDIFMQIMTLCNNSSSNLKEGNKNRFVGDPTEVALLNFAYSKGFTKEDLELKMPRVNEIPFDSVRKLMTTINLDKNSGKYRVFTKGAPDVLIKRCNRLLINGEVVPLTQEYLDEIEKANNYMASKALRVLGMAYKDIESIPQNITSEIIENDLIFVGLTGMIDPPRKEVKDAIKICKHAGIRPIMITGDHKDTALAIAKELGIISDESQLITGSELDKLSDEIFEKQVEKYSVYARVSPEHKLRIVKAWKKKGMVVAMTGDGVNDAPALKSADIGIGMGITGTDVSKDVSDMVLADDNFATIVLAVKEGRRIYSNIRKVIHYLLSANLGEVLTLFIATLLNWPILLPIHILWINLVTDSLPALALGVEEADKDIMEQKPANYNTSIFSNGLGINIICHGIVEGFITLFIFYIGITKYTVEVSTTMAFATLGLIQLVHAFNVRTGDKSAFSKKFASNKSLLWALLVSGILQIIVIVIPYFNHIFEVSYLNLNQWLWVVAASLSIIPVVEIIKFMKAKIKTKT